MSEPAIRKALTAEEVFLKQDRERYLYEMREKALWDEASQLEGAREEGKKEGVRDIACKMLAAGMSETEVAKITGLTEADIRSLMH